MELKKYIAFAFILLSVSLAIAAMNDTKLVVCNSINITEPNCTTWWNTLNLTDINFTTNVTTYLNVTYINNITVVHNDNRNQTINLTTINTNHSTIENKTYIIYNYTGNISDMNFSYADDKIKDFIPSSEVDTKISSALSGYALKTEITNSTAVDELEDSLGTFKWIFAILIIIIIVAVGILFMKSYI